MNYHMVAGDLGIHTLPVERWFGQVQHQFVPGPSTGLLERLSPTAPLPTHFLAVHLRGVPQLGFR